MAREGVCSVSLSGSEHFPRGVTWYVTWLPHGYAPTKDDRLICAFPFIDGEHDGFGLGGPEPPPPEIKVVADALTDYFRSKVG